MKPQENKYFDAFQMPACLHRQKALLPSIIGIDRSMKIQVAWRHELINDVTQWHELEPFAGNPKIYIKLFFVDGRVIEGNEFKRYGSSFKGGLNVWQIKPNDISMRLVDGFSIKEAKRF